MSIGIAARWKLAQATRLIDANEKSIVFVSPLLRPREIKMATALRGIGWKVVLVYQQTTPFYPENFFDIAIQGDSVDEIHTMVRLIRPRLCHLFSGAVDDLVLRFCRDKPAPVIVDLNDIFCPTLFNYLSERFEPTRECLQKADGLCARDLQAKFAQRKDHFRLPPNILHFPEYSWLDGPKHAEAAKKGDPGEVSVVSVGTFTLETQGMFDSAHLKLAQMLTDQKIHFHIYPHWFYRKSRGTVFKFDLKNDFREFLELEENTPYLHLHESLPIDQLARELTQYDFGLVSGACPDFGQKLQFLTQDYMDCCYSGRISDFLDARLPVLINKEVSFNTKLLNHYGIGVNLNDLVLPGFREKLLALKADPALKARVDRAADLMGLERHATRLGEFYSSIIQRRNQTAVRQPAWLHHGKIIPVIGRAFWRLEQQVVETSERAQRLQAEADEARQREKVARAYLATSISEVGQLRTHTADLVRQVADRQTRIIDLQKTVETQLEDIGALQRKLDEQQVLISTLQSEIDIARQLNVSYQQLNVNYQRQNAEYQQQISNQADALSASKAREDELVGKLSESEAAARNREAALEDRILRNEERARADLLALEERILARQDKISDLQQEVVSGQTQLANLQIELESKQIRISDLQDEIYARQNQISELGLKLLAIQERNVELVASLERSETLRHEAESATSGMRSELKIGHQQIDEIAGLLNWPELSDDNERRNSFFELVKLLNLSTRPFGGGKAISESWQLLNRKHLDELLRDGFSYFKRTIGMNYFTFPIQGGDPQILTLEAKLGAEVSARCRKIADEHPNDPTFDLPDQAAYRYFVLLLWKYVESVDREGALQRLIEPEVGHPILVEDEGRRISQDLANSVIEYYAMRDVVDFTRCQRVIEIGAGYGRDAYVIMELHPHIKYFVVDIAPALYVAQRYLCTVFPKRRVFQARDFATYREVQSEMKNADLVFLLPHQLARMPAEFFDLAINISSFGEMTREQIAHYTEVIDQTTRGHFYTKQWHDSKNPFDALELKESDYPVPKRWQRIYSRTCPVQASFFEAIYKIGDDRT